MLLYGFLLVSMVLVTAQVHRVRLVTVCTQGNVVKSVDLPDLSNETDTRNCYNAEVDRYGILTLWNRHITGFEGSWYHLESDQFHGIEILHTAISEITWEMLNDLPANIRIARLSYNNIERLRQGIIDNQYLTQLGLSHNFIDAIEDGALENLQQLKLLALDNNKLNNTEFAATLPPNLRDLILSNNEITEISANSFSKLGKLRLLLLPRNKITVILQQAFHGLNSLEYLTLSENPITILENGLFKNTPLLTTVICEMSGESCAQYQSCVYITSLRTKVNSTVAGMMCRQHEHCTQSTLLTNENDVLLLYQNKTLELSKASK